jgi:hypothetical protein
MIEWTPLSTREVIQISTTCLLAIIAFVAPYAVWRLQRRHLAPKLRASYTHAEPTARLSSRTVQGRAAGPLVYDFHFKVTNTGRTPAKNTVAEIVEFWHEAQPGKLSQLQTFMPVYLRYHQTEFVDVHPQRPYYWNIGDIYDASFQGTWTRGSLYDAPGKARRGLRFRLDLHSAPHNQVNVLLKGTYGLKIVLYSEDAKPEIIRLKITWSGKWRASLDGMLKQIVIQEVKSF